MKFDWSIWSFWIGILSLALAILFFAYTFFHKETSELQFQIISESKILSTSEDIPGLSIVYENEELKKTGKNMTVFVTRVRNSGEKPVLKAYFDNDVAYGIKIKNGTLVNQPEVINASNFEYFANPLKAYNSSKISLKEFIYNPKDYFDIKFLIVHYNNVEPTIETFGAIAHQATIELTTFSEESPENKSITKWIMAFGIISFVLVLASLYASKRRSDLYKKEIQKIADEKLKMQDIIINKLKEDM